MIDIRNVSLQFGGEYLFRDVSLTIHSGDKFSLVGSNGAGKTSLFRLITGILQPESGDIIIQKKIKIGYLQQEQIIHEGKILLDEASSGAQDVIALREREREITMELEAVSEEDDVHAELIEQLGSIHHRLEDLDSYTLESRIKQILIGLGFTNDDFTRETREFSGGWQMRIALAKILIAEPEIILLDEPTNHLDIDSQRWLANFLRAFSGALLLISHDRYFVNEVTNKTIEIFLNKISLYKGNYEAFLKFKEERNKQLENQAILQDKKIKDIEKFIDRFRYKATKAKQVQSRIKLLEKIDVIELQGQEQSINFSFSEPTLSGSTVFELRNITQKYGERTILNDLSLVVIRGEKIALVGPNGAGKTTLARIIAGDLKPSSGTVIPGYNVQTAFYTQNTTDLLDTSLDVLESILPHSDGRNLGRMRALAGSFLFKADDVFKKVSMLSGGEKSRLALLITMLSKANTLIFDEPTNHLDFDSKQILKDAVSKFQGTVIVVSHDVDFLSFPLSRIIEIRPGSMKQYAGDIHYYLAKKIEESESSSNAYLAKGGSASQAVVNKSDRKRTEAAKRNEKYKATKDIIKRIDELESEITKFEMAIKQSEHLLALPETYSKDGEAAEVTRLYNKQKEELARIYSRWEKDQLILEELNKQFQ